MYYNNYGNCNALSRLNTGSQFLNQRISVKQSKAQEYSVPFSVTMSPIKQQRESYQPIIENYFNLQTETQEDRICFDCLNNFIALMTQGTNITKQIVIENLTGLRNLIDFILNSQQDQSGILQQNSGLQSIHSSQIEQSMHNQLKIPEIQLLEQKRFPNGVNRLLEEQNKSLQSYLIIHQSQQSERSLVNQTEQQNESVDISNQSYYSEYKRQAQNIEMDLQSFLKQK
ncbi:unnamed protein product (macronuclear) [Paramecium tetraurelia]|uniref:Uncharacterized protein n=1 Tax=Paramecium tetraurelia TaxID=5888 RepID=A0EAB5_PARTE|nr:uncharacterized protein GSPATT00024964001 [Paramecium tetraurelia]CAK92232.1 unnamed protein product [Paramecium tetraurelia]|eukprot:XP_001459629.1 hypothetical protein (macronuclear) [Paramecium tetraurelia strain d4-2]